MPNDDNHNIFDKDDTQDFLICKECEKGVRNRQKGNDGKGGCLGLLLLPVVPVGLLAPFCLQLFRS